MAPWMGGRINEVIRFGGVYVVAWLLRNSLFFDAQFTFPASAALWQKLQYAPKWRAENSMNSGWWRI